VVEQKHQVLRCEEAVAAIESIADQPTRRVIRRAASLALAQFFTTQDSTVCDFDIAFFVSILEQTLRKKEIVLQELKGEACADWWEVDG
jgi:hypothetical protein